MLDERRGTPAVLDCAAADLADALEYVDGSGTVRSRPELVDWLRRKLPANARVSVEPDPSVGLGAVVRAADGSVEIDATVERRLARLRPRLAVLALGMLEKSDGAGLG